MSFLLSHKQDQLKKKGSGYNVDYTVTPDFVRSHLLSYAKKSSAKSKSILIPCPFHSESEPSLSVIVSADHRLPVGSWKCFGCNRAGHWNVLAEALHLPLINSGKNRKFSHVEDRKGFNIGESRESHTLQDLSKRYEQKLVTAKPWPEKKAWRGFSGSVVNKYEGMHVPLDEYYPLWFKAHQKRSIHKLIGVIRCLPQKQKRSPMKSYIFSDGEWLSSYMWPEVHIEPTEFVVLVEGIRDALALLWWGIPALAILGSNTGISESRFMTLMSLGITEIITFMDGDRAGKQGSRIVKDDIGMEMYVREFKTWKVFPGKDPFKLAQDTKFVARFKHWINRGRRT